MTARLTIVGGVRDALAADAEPVEYFDLVLGIAGPLGWVLRIFRYFSLPIIAFGGRRLYRVLIEGEGFELPLKSVATYPTHFFTTRFVPARTALEAETRARKLILLEWNGLSLLSTFTGTDAPCLSVVEAEVIDGWFRWTSGRGFTLFRREKVDDVSEAHVV
jgi:hypothetical protein